MWGTLTQGEATATLESKVCKESLSCLAQSHVSQLAVADADDASAAG